MKKFCDAIGMKFLESVATIIVFILKAGETTRFLLFDKRSKKKKTFFEGEKNKSRADTDSRSKQAPTYAELFDECMRKIGFGMDILTAVYEVAKHNPMTRGMKKRLIRNLRIEMPII